MTLTSCSQKTLKNHYSQNNNSIQVANFKKDISIIKKELQEVKNSSEKKQCQIPPITDLLMNPELYNPSNWGWSQLKTFEDLPIKSDFNNQIMELYLENFQTITSYCSNIYDHSLLISEILSDYLIKSKFDKKNKKLILFKYIDYVKNSSIPFTHQLAFNFHLKKMIELKMVTFEDLDEFNEIDENYLKNYVEKSKIIYDLLDPSLSKSDKENLYFNYYQILKVNHKNDLAFRNLVQKLILK